MIRAGRLPVVVLLVAVLGTGAVAAPSVARASLAPGDQLGPETWEQARDLLPQEFLESYRRGDFRHRIGEFHVDRIGDEPVFREALAVNEGRYALDERGSIVEARTGQPPDYVYAWPFPSIDPADPQAAIKIVWNYFYMQFYGGNGHFRADINWVSRSGLDRAMEVDHLVKHYDGQHPRFREPDADRELLSQTLDEVLGPSDVSGIVSLSWRYRGAARRDSMWAFVPALRRVRQVSPANRSDGFLGSDLSPDDGMYFEGKVEDFTWKLVGEQDLLVLFDRPSFENPAALQRLPGGGWRMVVPGGARVGFQVPDWPGAPWCPMQEILVRRPHWVVEAVPKDPYYLFGKLVLRFDKDLFMGSYSSKYDWKGNLITSYSAIRTNIVKAAPGELWGWVGGAVALALNWKLDRATTAGLVAGEDVPMDSRIPLAPSLFSLQHMMERGR